PEARAVDVHAAVSVARALDGVDALVNAVGPYRYDPAQLVRACTETGVHYVDLAEGPAFLARARDAAKVASVAVVPGCSTVPGMLELLARPFFALPGAARIDAWLSMGSANAVSAALLDGLLAPLGRAAPDGARYFGELETREIGDRRLRFGRHPAALADAPIPVRLHVGFDRAPLVFALRAVAPGLGRLSEAAVSRLARVGAPLASVVRPFGTPRGVLRVEALDPASRTLASVEVEAREHGLDVPAWPAVWAVRRLLQKGAGPGGALSLGDLVPRAEALAALRGAGFDVRENLSS
ncbi:MAG: saccharopine dehydrogenase NADP-binding domain-containing protein, partial [Myxococcota bacterium]